MDVKKLEALLDNAVKESCPEKVGIIFSGGIDSTIAAILASKHAKVTAYSCGVEGSIDLEHAKECEGLGFKIKYIDLTDEDVEHALKPIVEAIHDRNPVKVSVEVPFYYTSKKAAEDGIEVMLCGQGADELFGGYARYLDNLSTEETALEKAMLEDILNIYPAQVDKDTLVCRSNNIELRCPYLNQEFKDYVIGLPLEYKLRESDEYLCTDEVDGKHYVRKYILRKLAENLEVPEKIIHRKKKAAQYGSGSQRTVDRIARKKGYKAKAKEAGRTDYVKMFLEEL